MNKPKARKEKLSIYLVKTSAADNISKFINVENSKPPIDMDVSGLKATLYVKKEPPKPPPPWTKLFTEHQALPDGTFGSRRAVGAAFVVSLKSKVFALTFGTGFHLIKNEAIERDFGLRVTLNSVDPDKLRSLDKASYDHNPLNSRTQSSIDLGVFDLDVDSEMDMLYAVTGVSRVPVFGSHVTGRDALTLVLEISLNGLKDVLSEAISRYEATLPKEFEWVDNIQRIKDKEILEVLDLELDDILAKEDVSDMWLGEPEIVDWESQVGYSFELYQKTPRHVVLRLKDLVQHFNDKEVLLTTENLKAQIIHINDNEFNSFKKWTAYRCLYAEVALGEEKYILRNGLWYRVNTNFEEEINSYLQHLDSYEFEFPLYTHDREEEYNAYVKDSHNNIELMDKEPVKVGGPYDKLEFCDLIKDTFEFIHVKYYRSSSTLSHLFSQGFVASEAFVGDSGFRKRLNEKLPESCKLTDIESRPDPSNYRIVYAIATNRNLPNELPFFSKVTLKNALKTLKTLNFNVSLSAIQVDPSLEVKKKYKPKKEKKRK
ncbi:MAG: TIGR04141 family sporadically distributed protein [Candidatus Thiodiazotropha endolucinida]|uniref:TIGR04141 family sporadically distributed protein n=1 Tax=Candidatus Thiodiazotropha taylori TaxID=2792791 RepID=A0A9E4TTP0_9GAMM|nr:TIGR04141 family sporadically distributed protein [Candidatus Thiodiazotropha taylori]MCW4236292.1 TIGR04141 family sporadically distributed protein [Candidatus Thiodiazotropha endolucinida]